MTISANLLVAILAFNEPASELQRQDRQDTIYVLNGEKSMLEAFAENVGADWLGGTSVDDDPSDGTLTYWAYSERTAAESRAFMMPAIMGGLKMDFAQYKEASQFPTERTKLDQVAIKCGFKTDPFFLTPKRFVEITMRDNASATQTTCLSEGVQLDVQLPATVSRQNKDAAEITKIEAKCGVKQGTLRLDGKVGFAFNPDPDEEYEKVDCALAELRESPLSRHFKYGFVGNEGPTKEEQK